MSKRNDTAAAEPKDLEPLEPAPERRSQAYRDVYDGLVKQFNALLREVEDAAQRQDLIDAVKAFAHSASDNHNSPEFERYRKQRLREEAEKKAAERAETDALFARLDAFTERCLAQAKANAEAKAQAASSPAGETQ